MFDKQRNESAICICVSKALGPCLRRILYLLKIQKLYRHANQAKAPLQNFQTLNENRESRYTFTANTTSRKIRQQ